MGVLQNIREVLKTIKRRPPSKIYCPKCGSPAIHFAGSTDFWLTPTRYLCNECGYLGPVVMELEKEED